MAKVKILVDSTSDIPHDVAKELDIQVIPLNVHFGEKTYLDWVELSPAEFYKLLETSPDRPRTSQPSPGDFARVYEELIKDGSEVCTIVISSALSGTFQSAEIGKSTLGKGRIEIVDSRLASMGFGMPAIEAARAAKAGKSLEEVTRLARDLCARVKIIFGVDTLEYLARNGRIGKAQALLGTLLSMKPLLTIEDGLVAPLDKVRGEKKVFPRMVELMGEMMEPGKTTKCGITHANCLDRAMALKAEVEQAHKVKDILVTDLGPVIGANAGPGTLGLVFYQP